MRGETALEASTTATEWIVDPAFTGFDTIAYAREFMEDFWTEGLLRVKVTNHDRAARYHELDFWGRCDPPTETLDGYRVSVFACGEDYHFPLGSELWRRDQAPGYRPGAYATHAGILKAEYVVRNVGEGLVHILGHELFHYVAFTGQTNLAHTERNADLVAYELLHHYREAEDPFLVCDALRVADPAAPAQENFRYAPHRWPYTEVGRV